jgi:hypothetical protein
MVAGGVAIRSRFWDDVVTETTASWWQRVWPNVPDDVMTETTASWLQGVWLDVPWRSGDGDYCFMVAGGVASPAEEQHCDCKENNRACDHLSSL